MSAPSAAITSKPSKTRSPNYPAISLDEAVQRLRVIYDKQQRYPATRDTFAKLLGYGGLHGASAGVISALSKYGLLEGHGDTLRVSEMGQDLIMHRKGDPEYAEALQAAVLMPAFFRELRDQYPYGLPSEHSVRASLIKRGFNPKAIDSAVRAYRDTIEFVDAEIGNSFAESQDESVADLAIQAQPHTLNPTTDRGAPLAPPGQRAVVLPLSVNEWATLHAPFPLSEGAWEQMLAVLTAMKPALVAPVEQPPRSSAPTPVEAASSQDNGRGPDVE